MRILIDELTIATSAPIELLDVTTRVRDARQRLRVQNGLLTLLSRHTTAYLNINESEAQLRRDMTAHLKRLVPRDGDYLHNLAPVDDRDNAHAHLLGLFMTASLSIPIVEGELSLGAWQSIFFIELDGPRRERRLTLHFLSED